MSTYIVFQLSLVGLILGFIVLIFRKHQAVYQLTRKTLDDVREDWNRRIEEAELLARENTLREVAMELHDNVTHTLALCKLELNALDQSAPIAAPGFGVMKATSLLSEAMSSLSGLSCQLSSQFIDQCSLGDAIEKCASLFPEGVKLKVKVNVTGQPFSLGNIRELHLYRIVQEALNNILKHAHATYASVELRYAAEHFECYISDDGVGLNDRVYKVGRSGLSNMRKRASIIGARLDISSGRNEGTIIRIYLPLLNQN